MLRIKGKWWRHTDYVLRDGYIVPAPGAELTTYDVFGEYLAQVEDARCEPDAIYVEFAALGRGTDEDIRQWCKTHGLLGVLPHELLGVDFAGGRRWIRNGNSWTTVSFSYTPGDTQQPGQVTKEGQVRLFGVPFAQKIEESLLPFFPGLPDSEPIPVPPLTDAFWRWYGEPVDKIRSYAWKFHRILASFTPPTRESAPEQWDAWGMRQQWMKWLADHGELRPNGDSDFPWRGDKGVPKADDITPVLASPNLISSLAVMCWQDLTGGAIAGVCHQEGCGKVFVTRRKNRKYCGVRCENAAAQKKVRSKAKAKRLHGEGWSVEDIVKEVGADVATVQSWLTRS